jgi:hypothetical protein
MPPSGEYSLRITPAAARATANKTKVQNVSTLLTILMAIVVRWYYTACIAQWRSVTFGYHPLLMLSTKQTTLIKSCTVQEDYDQTKFIKNFFSGV